jgi:N-acyl amino acid synthase of PEP-CTERM/exosortase system
MFGVPNLGEGFRKYFEVIPALTEELKEETFRIRHSVYCEDLKFEPVRPDRRETDYFDAQSLHCLLRNVNNGEFVGCARLILTERDDPLRPLPFEERCVATLDRAIVDPQRLPRDRLAEVSRMAVIKKYRQRATDQQKSGGIADDSWGDAKRPRFPYIPVGLYLAVIELAMRHGVDTLFVLTEPRLTAHFGRLGVKTTQIGGPVEHRGKRLPSMMDCKAIVDGLNFLTRPLYEVIAADVERAIGPGSMAARPFETPITEINR